MIRSATTADSAAIAEIYNHYILNTTITFEETAVTAGQIAGRISEITSLGLPWLVVEQNKELAGFCYAGRFRDRSAYRFSLESAVYLRHGLGGKGLGSALYAALIEDLEKRDGRQLIGGIALPNPESVALHEKFGFRKVAHFEQVGFKFGQWIDVGFWQRSLGVK